MKRIISALAVLLLFGGPLMAAENLPDPKRVFQWNREERLTGFKSVEKITPVNTVGAGGKARALAAPSSPLALKLAELLDKPTADFMKSGDIVGVMVINNGEVIVERYAHGFSRNDRWTSFSVAKSFTATLAGAALADGSLKSLDDLVIDYVPELNGSAYDGVTIRHLLTMTSGVYWNEDYTDPKSHVADMALGAGDSSRDQLDVLKSLPRFAKPGSTFDYRTGESNLLGIVIMRATGKSLSDYLTEKIWKPFGMEKAAYWALDGQGREMAGCCLSMTLGDYARFGLFMLGGGKIGDEQVVDSQWYKDGTRDITGHHYGYQWRMVDDGVFAATGIFGQLIAVDTKTGSVAVILSAWDHPVSRRGNEKRFEYLFKIRALALTAASAQGN